MPIEIYHAYIDTADTTLLTRLWERLPPARRAVLADRADTARAEGTALTALLTCALEGWGDGIPFRTLPPAALTTPHARWETATDGKPFPRGIETPHGLVFPSFSHCRGHLLVALCDRPLGADLLVWDAPAFTCDRFARLAARIVHPAETPPATARETARCFAAKEAILKLRGTGLRQAMSSVRITDFAVTFYEDVPACVIAVALPK